MELVALQYLYACWSRWDVRCKDLRVASKRAKPPTPELGAIGASVDASESSTAKASTRDKVASLQDQCSLLGDSLKKDQDYVMFRKLLMRAQILTKRIMFSRSTANKEQAKELQKCLKACRQ